MTRRMISAPLLLLMVMTVLECYRRNGDSLGADEASPPTPAGRAGEAEEKAVKAIEGLGGGVNAMRRRMASPSFWWTVGTKVTDADLKELAALKQLRGLDLTSTRVTDAGLKELAHSSTSDAEFRLHAGDRRGTEGTGPIQTASVAELMDTKVTDAGLKELAPLKQLQSLNLGAPE